MSDPRYLPTTPEGRLLRLVEECDEVLQCVGKLGRFGVDNYHPRDPLRVTNRAALLAELRDVRLAAKLVARDLGEELADE